MEKSFTPHARGSTLGLQKISKADQVYPACAGIDPERFWFESGCLGLPRMRGDRPAVAEAIKAVEAFTPHARGSTWTASPPCDGGTVYPACAGIDLVTKITTSPAKSLPRMRGDRPPSGRFLLRT